MMVTGHSPGLPAYADYVSSVETAPRAAPRLPFAVLVVLGVILIAEPLLTGMFPRAAKGEAMIGDFAPFVTQSELDGYRGDLGVLDAARTDIAGLRAQGLAPGTYDRIDTFVRDYPGIRSDLSTTIDTIDAQRGNYQRLADLPPLGTLPWLLALAGLVFVAAGVFGWRRAVSGRRGGGWRVLSALVGAALVIFPIAGGLFAAAPAGQPLLDGFRPVLTHDEVRKVQGYFVTLVAADGELNSRFTADVRAAHPDADLTAITTLEQRWQPMTSHFAALIGAMNDNVGHLDAVAALNDSTKPLGFTAFRGLGWFFLVPGVIALAAAAWGSGVGQRIPVVRNRVRRPGDEQ
ncbi:hypothetical protein [Nocardia nova]|uniref:hypothetical protein n=1 Tax=Nocardia nova TaxID=37330 RepID=UPI0033CAAD16